MTARLILLATLAGWLPATPAPAAGKPEKTQQLIAVLRSEATLFEKARACQQLGEVGTAEAVPALAALLPDEHLSAYARSGLEGIPDASAAAALRTALGEVHGKLLAGVVNSLGVLRDRQAVGPLGKLALEPGSGVAKEALLALGSIASAESIQCVRQTLADGPEQFRPEAAAACLLAAERLLSGGNLEPAAALYDAVRQAKVPPACRTGATRGAILARASNRLPFLIEQLESDDRATRAGALLAIREIPDDQLPTALNAELDRARPELQLQLLAALADRHNPQSIPAIQAKAAGEDPEIRKAALAVLGKIGGPAAAQALLSALAGARSADESALALDGLRRMEGAAIDDLLLQALAAASPSAMRAHLIHLLHDRGVTKAAAELLKQAAVPDQQVSLAAFAALRSLAGPNDVPALIALTKACTDEAVRAAAESAVAGACAKSGDGAPGAEAVLAELKQATEPALKNSWVRILTALGYAKALPALQAVLRDSNEAVVDNALLHLGRWPDPAPIDDLLAVLETSPSPRLHKRAIAAVLDLAVTAADEKHRPEASIVAWLQRAAPAIQSIEEKRRLISVLGRLNTIESFHLLRPYLSDAGVRTEAAVAVVQIAPPLAKGEASADLKAALENIAQTAQTPDLRGRAAQVAKTIPAKRAPVSLFDGSSLSGWEGDTNVWRVRDGVIVGGSLKGNPRNEFLATVRSYTNFVIRLEYKLIGTEGFINSGVQFRSVRLTQPPNEMKGYQADIGAGHSGCLYDESRRNSFLARAPDAQIQRLEKPGDWNRYEVRCEARRIQITLNGEKTVDYTEADTSLPQDGLFGLQMHGGCKAEVSFRNIILEEL